MSITFSSTLASVSSHSEGCVSGCISASVDRPNRRPWMLGAGSVGLGDASVPVSLKDKRPSPSRLGDRGVSHVEISVQKVGLGTSVLAFPGRCLAGRLTPLEPKKNPLPIIRMRSTCTPGFGFGFRGLWKLKDAI